MVLIGNKNKRANSAKVHTLVGGETEVHGDICFDGGLFVDGTVVGNVEAKSDTASVLNLSDKGSIEGQVKVPHVILNGTVTGDVYASERIELAASAKVVGNLYYNLIEMAIGAEINGQMIHKEKTDRSASKSSVKVAVDVSKVATEETS